MDSGNSELRYMNTSNCSSPYGGVISNFTAADIVASAGPRVPDSTTAQQNFRTGWVMIHQPASAPTSGELNKAVGILQQHQRDWSQSTIGRGSMNNSLFVDFSCLGGVVPALSSSALALLALLLMTAGVLVILRRQP